MQIDEFSCNVFKNTWLMRSASHTLLQPFAKCYQFICVSSRANAINAMCLCYSMSYPHFLCICRICFYFLDAGSVFGRCCTLTRFTYNGSHSVSYGRVNTQRHQWFLQSPQSPQSPPVPSIRRTAPSPRRRFSL